MCEAMGEGACTACGVRCPSAEHLQTHCASQRHQDRIAFLYAEQEPLHLLYPQPPPPPPRQQAPFMLPAQPQAAAQPALQPVPASELPAAAAASTAAALTEGPDMSTFECPISMELMSDPCIAADGQTVSCVEPDW